MREATWSRVGTDVSDVTSVQDVLTWANLDYEVVKRPIFLGDGYEIKDKVATVKKETGSYIGTVSPSYQIYQNREAFDFIDSIPDIEFVKAGETIRGMVYIIGKLPDLTVLNDTFTPHVIFQTSHNGRFNVRATICPLRIVCQNQFAWTFKHVQNTINLRHSTQLPAKVAQAQQLIIDTAQYMNGFTNTAEELALLKLGDGADVYKIMDAFFQSTKELTERQRTMLEAKEEFFMRCYQADDNAEFRGTAWGLVNAFTDYQTHRERKKTKTADESAFVKVTFDNSALERFMKIVQEYVH